jgi:hypothetical protein
MGRVEVTIHQVVDVVAVGHSLVSTTGSVMVRRIVGSTGVPVRTDVGIGVAHGHRVFVDVATVHMVEVAIVEVVYVTFVLDANVSAIGAVLMGVSVVDFASGHGVLQCVEAALFTRRSLAPTEAKSSTNFNHFKMIDDYQLSLAR